jgi:hypothetical protein
MLQLGFSALKNTYRACGNIKDSEVSISLANIWLGIARVFPMLPNYAIAYPKSPV